MSSLVVELPEELRAKIAGQVAHRGISESEWLQEAAREKLAMEAEQVAFQRRSMRASRSDFERVLAKVPDVEPVPGDEK